MYGVQILPLATSYELLPPLPSLKRSFLITLVSFRRLQNDNLNLVISNICLMLSHPH